MKPKLYLMLALVLLMPTNVAWAEELWGFCEVRSAPDNEKLFITEVFQAKKREYLYFNGEIDEITFTDDGYDVDRVTMYADNRFDYLPSIDEVDSSRDNYLKLVLTLARNISNEPVSSILCYFYDDRQISEYPFTGSSTKKYSSSWTVQGNPNDLLDASGGQSPDVRGDVSGSGAWYAIAFTDDEDALGWGWVVGAASKGRAQITAVRECETIGRGDCSVEDSGEGTCIAIAESEEGIAWVFGRWDNSPSASAEADRQVMDECRQTADASCEVTTNTCADE